MSDTPRTDAIVDEFVTYPTPETIIYLAQELERQNAQLLQKTQQLEKNNVELKELYEGCCIAEDWAIDDYASQCQANEELVKQNTELRNEIARLERENAETKLRCESLRQSYQKEIDGLKGENAELRESIERHGQANDKLILENAALRKRLEMLAKSEGEQTNAARNKTNK